MKDDFETWAAVIAFIVNSAGMTGLWRLLQNSDLEKLKKDLSEQVKTRLSVYGYVERRHKELRKQLFSFWLLLLHFINLSILLGLFLVLYAGPENIFWSPDAAALAGPLSSLEKTLYWSWFGLFLLGYLISGFSPTSRLLRLLCTSRKWLRGNVPKKKEYRNGD